MWFKQATFYQLSQPLQMSQQQLSEALMPLTFTPCLPSLHSSHGWIAVMETDAGPLVYGNKKYWMICLQFEDKILPASVVQQILREKINEIEKKEARKIRAKEKKSLKDEIIQTLLPKAFSKKSVVHAYIDLDHRRVMINSTTPAKIEHFVSFLKRVIAPIDMKTMDVKKPMHVMTQWLKNGDAPDGFTIGQSCTLQDPQQQRRVIRCQHQDLLASSVQLFLKDGCEIAQLALSWKDQLQFVLSGDFSLKNIQCQEAVLALAKSDYTETPEQRFDADFAIMTEILSRLADDLCAQFSVKVSTKATGKETVLV